MPNTILIVHFLDIRSERSTEMNVVKFILVQLCAVRGMTNRVKILNA